MSLRRLTIAAALAALSLSSATARASVTVNTPIDELAVNRACSLREAITLLDGDDTTDRGCTNTAVDPTTINLPASASAYTLTVHGTANDTNTAGDLDIYRDMTIAGAGAPSTVIDGDHADRVFDIYRNDPAKDPNPTVTISGVTITNGAAPSLSGISPNGGGIEVYDSFSSLTLNSDVINENAAGSPPNGTGAPGGGGGGVYSAGSLTVNSSTVDHNLAGDGTDSQRDGGDGGGIDSLGVVNVTNSTVTANVAGKGGTTGTASGGAGGGIYALPGGTITASTIAFNTAGDGGDDGGGGGGIFGSSLTLVNSTIAFNHAGDGDAGSAGSGGGVNSAGNSTLTNDTIVSNAAGAAGSTPGVGNAIATGGGSDHIANSIVKASALGRTCATSNYTDDGHNLTFGDSSCAGFTVADPGLMPLHDNGGPTQTFAIQAGSPAHDQIPASGANCPATDQRGVPRPQGSACDIGAFELVKRYSVSVTKTGTGSGSVASAPAGIDCGLTCSAQIDQGTAVTLTATADPGSTFAGWSGGGCSGTGPCTFTESADTTVVATFEPETTPPAPPTDAPPNTKISKAKIDSDAGTAKFTFGTTTEGKASSGFQCALISKKHRKPKFKDCTSPKKYKHLKPGKYKFEVRAFDAAGTDSTPAKKKFKIE